MQMHDLRRFITIAESAEGDLDQHAIADQVVQRLVRHFYDGHGGKNYGMKWTEINFGDDETDGIYYVLYGKTAGLDDLVPNLMILFGKRKGYDQSGLNARLSKPVLGHTRMIFLWCTPSDDDPEKVKSMVVNNTQTHHILKHEVIHYLDYERRTGKPEKKAVKGDWREDPHSDMSGYYNSAVEFNAYFHNLADRLISLVRGMRDHPESAKDYADLYDFDADIRSFLKKAMTAQDFNGLKGFLKHLDPRNRQRAIKRLYALHQQAKQLLANQPERVTESERQKGKSLPETGFKEAYAIIYRGVLTSVTTFQSMDYVTMNRRWAIEHAQHVAAVEGEEAHVLRAMVPAKQVFEAYNPGEYFYDGPSIPGRQIKGTDMQPFIATP